MACRLSTETIAVYHVLTRDCHSGVPRSPGGVPDPGGTELQITQRTDCWSESALSDSTATHSACQSSTLGIDDDVPVSTVRCHTQRPSRLVYNCNLHILTHISPVFYLSTFSYLESWTFIVLVYYGRPLSVSGCPCYILPMFFLIFIFNGHLIHRPWLTEVRERFTRGRP